jgi:hypothetical protein
MRPTFWISDTASQKKPIAKRTIPAISLLVPKAGLAPPRERSDTAGEFRMTVGSASLISDTTTYEERRGGHTDNPDPYNLECPESGEFEEMGPHIVESGIGTCLQNSEE